MGSRVCHNSVLGRRARASERRGKTRKTQGERRVMVVGGGGRKRGKEGRVGCGGKEKEGRERESVSLGEEGKDSEFWERKGKKGESEFWERKGE